MCNFSVAEVCGESVFEADLQSNDPKDFSASVYLPVLVTVVQALISHVRMHGRKN